MTTLESMQPSSQVGGAGSNKRKLDDAVMPRSGELSADSSIDDNSASLDGKIPETKRRTQNRAAQRAFRERKERHLKDLETRLADLESESRNWKSTNIALRSKLSLLENELEQYRWPNADGKRASSAVAAIEKPTGNAPQFTPSHSDISGQSQYEFKLKTEPFDNPPSLESPSSNSSGVPTCAEEFCEQLSQVCVVNKKTAAADAPRISAETPGWQTPLGTMPLSGVDSWLSDGQPPLQYQGDEKHLRQKQQYFYHRQLQLDSNFVPLPVFGNRKEPLNLDFGSAGEPDPTSNQLPLQTDNDLMLYNDFGVFDPLDGLVGADNQTNTQNVALQNSGIDMRAIEDPMQYILNGYSTEGNNQISNEINNEINQEISSPEFRSPEFRSPVFHSPSFEVPYAIHGAMAINGINSTGINPGISEVGGGLTDALSNALGEEQVPTSSQKFILCTDVWDRICAHPRFCDIDINSMCQELCNKARCSKMGVVLDEHDVDQVLEASQRPQ